MKKISLAVVAAVCLLSTAFCNDRVPASVKPADTHVSENVTNDRKANVVNKEGEALQKITNVVDNHMSKSHSANN